MSATPHRIFISYARRDGRSFAARLRAELESEFSVWQDVIALQGGDDWWQKIKEAIEGSDVLVLVLTERALLSYFVRREWVYARRMGKTIIPVVLDEAVLKDAPRWVRRSHAYILDPAYPDYAEHRAGFLSQLRDPQPQPPVLNQTPPLPDSFIARPRLESAVLDALIGTDRADPYFGVTTLLGAGGFGKSTLAQAVGGDPDVTEAYIGGVYYVTVGESEGTFTQGLNAILRDLHLPEVPPEQAAAKVREALAERDCLLILDDVWNKEAIRLLLSMPQCHVLITTREPDVAALTSGNPIIIEEMDPNEAAEMLLNYLPHDTESSPSDRAAMLTLANRLGEWPLLLNIFGMVLREEVLLYQRSLTEALDYINDGLDDEGLIAFDRTDAGRNAALEASMQVSLRRFTDAERARLFELSAFPNDVSVSENAALVVWRGTADLKAFSGKKLLRRFMGGFLMPDAGGAFRIHDRMLEYLQSKLGRDGLLHTHIRLIAAWGDPYALPDAYAWRFYGYHLIGAGQADRLRALLLDPAYLQAKLVATDANALIADCDRIVLPRRQAGEDETSDAIRLLRSALTVSAHVLAEDTAQLASQVVGRLMPWRADKFVVRAFTDALMAQRVGVYPAFPDGEYHVLNPAGGPLLRTLIGHKHIVTNVVLIPDGATAVSASWDNTLIVWDIATGEARHTLTGHTDRVNYVAIMLNGATAVSASDDNTLIVWDLATGTAQHRLTGHTDKVNHVAVTPDGSTAVSASDDHTLIVWDVATGTARHRLNGHTGVIWNVEVTPDGSAAVSSSDDKKLIVWDLTSGTLLRILISHTDVVNHVSLTLVGETAISASGDKTLIVWDIATGAARRVLTGHTGAVNYVAATPDGRTAVSVSEDSTLIVWDIATGIARHMLNGHTSRVNYVALTPDGGTAVSSSDDGTLIVWDIVTGTERQSLTGHTRWVSRVAVTPDGATAVSAADDGNVIVWDLTAKSFQDTKKAHTEAVNHIAVTPDGATAVSASLDTMLLVWDIATGTVRHILNGHSYSVSYIAVTTDRASAISASNDGTLIVWDTATGAPRYVLTDHTKWVNHIAVTSDGATAVSASGDNTLIVWDIATGTIRHRLIGHTDSVRHVAVTSDGATAVSASRDKTLIVWDVATGAARQTLTGHTSKVNHVAMTLDGATIVSVSEDIQNQRSTGEIIVWNPAIGKARYVLTVQTGRLTLVALTPDGATVVLGSDHGALIVWDIEARQILSQMANTVEGMLEIASAYPTLTEFDGFVRADGWELAYGGRFIALRAPDGRTARFTADADIRSARLGAGGIVVAGDQAGRVLFLKMPTRA